MAKDSKFISDRIKRLNKQLEKFLPALITEPKTLHQAMRYSVLNGGKRIRPLLVYAAGEGFGAKPSQLDAAACAIELVHCYSLIHDDLPAMDNDDFRRGKPTCHKAFGEATAILAGDALANLAAKILSDNKSLSFEQRLNMIQVLAQSSSSDGMVGGQVLELETAKSKLTIKKLEHIHNLKTGALITAAVKLGALAAGKVSFQQFKQLETMAQKLGLAFQIQDDINDCAQDKTNTNEVGNYVSLLGFKKAEQRLAQLSQEVSVCLDRLGAKGKFLKIIVAYTLPCAIKNIRK